MSEQNLYLKPNVQLEPLFNRWYAWHHLVAPATAAMNIANSHLKIMKSYIASPQIHANAVKNPAMIGGPFIDYDGRRVDEIKALLEQTTKEQSRMLSLADAIKSLSDMLSREAQGYSLEPLYQKVPEPLKGRVELVYDLNNQPSFRFIERLMYRGPYYDTSSQSAVLSLVNQDYRPFVFSTPRLDSADHVHLNAPFNSEGLDELFKMRTTPGPLGHIKEALAITDEQLERMRPFFTEDESVANVRPDPFEGDGVRVRYYGHACLLIESRDIAILTDPVISYRHDSELFRYTYSDLPEKIDYVLITHSHSDHILFETLLQIRHKIKNIVVPRNNGGSLEDPSLKLALNNTGFANVIEIDELESIEVEGGSITSLPFLGEHADLNIRSKTAHLVTLKGRSIACAADSSNLEPKLYELVQQIVGNVDVLFLGMECDGAPLTWIYGPLLTRPLDRKMDRSRKLSGSDYERGIDIVKRLGCKQVYVYALGQEPWLTYITSIKYTKESKQIVESDKLLEACGSLGVISERLYGSREIVL